MKRIIFVWLSILLLGSANAAASTVLAPGSSWSGTFQSVYNPTNNMLEGLEFFESGQGSLAWQLNNDGGNNGDFHDKWRILQIGGSLVFDFGPAGNWQMLDGGTVYSGTFTDLSVSGPYELTIILATKTIVAGNRLPGAGSASVSAVPVPGAVWLLGSGILGLLCLRKKN